MKKIKLTQNKFALVDDLDFEWLNQWKWWTDSSGYAVRDIGGRKNKKRILMHRFLNQTPEGFSTDHINHNRLDNRKKNLRTLTQQKNCFNSSLSKNNKSGVSGVSWYKNGWVARIKINYKGIYLGRFENLNDAIEARKKGELQYHAI